jgi:hypothetical protein
VLRVGAELGAKRAADIRGDDPYQAGLDLQHPGERALGPLRALIRNPGSQAAVLTPRRGGTAGFHRRRSHSLVDDGLADDHLAAVEQVTLQVSRIAPPACHVGARVLEQQGVIARVEAEHGRQRVVVHRHQLERVLALVRLLDHDHGDRLPDVADLVGGQQALLDLRLHRAGRPKRRQVRHVRAGEHGHHARGLEGGARVDAVHPGMRDRRPDEEDVAGAVQPLVHQILDVDTARRQEARILGPQDPGT